MPKTSDSLVLESRLLDNHALFLATHRGELAHSDGLVVVRSSRPEFTFAILEHEERWERVAAVSDKVYLPSWTWGALPPLVQRGFRPKGGLTYMRRGSTPPRWPTNPDVMVTRATDESGLDAFSLVQAQAFTESPDAFAIWHPFLREANLRNAGNPDQYFLVGHLGDEPAGTTLLVIDGDFAGIYAVATLVEHRRKRVSTSLLAHAVALARQRGCREITLQVAPDSPAEALYFQLGFEACFLARFLSRPPSPA